MNDALTTLDARGDGLIRLAVSAVLASAFTVGLFWSIAHFERDAPPPPVLYDDVPRLAVAIEPPPPPPTQTTPQTEATATPVAGFDLTPAADNPVKIAVPPPELEALLPPAEAAPPAKIQFGRLDTSFRPKMDMDVAGPHIFQVKEVDQLPMVLYKVEPHVPRRIRDGADVLRVAMLIVVNADGAIAEVRVSQSSGNPEFDALIAANIREWAFRLRCARG